MKTPVLHLLILLFICLSCQQEDGFEKYYALSQENEDFYQENNRLATRRLFSIMYTDSSQQTERFKLVHISDPHLSFWSENNNCQYPINLIQSIRFANQPDLKINAMVATGDFISNGGKDEALQNMRAFVRFFYQDNRIPSFLCTGNHDSNAIDYIEGSFIYKSELNSILFPHADFFRSQNKAQNYYYADLPNPQGGWIRIISLDMLDQPDNMYNTLYYAHYSEQQIRWLIHTALKEEMTDQHHVIILTHYPFQHNDPNASTYLCDGDYVHDWNMIPEIIEAFRQKTTWQKAYFNKVLGDSLLVQADFANYKGDFIAYLGGHSHCNACFNVLGLSNQQQASPQKMILCTNQAPSETGVVYNRIRREENSLSSNSFCIHAIDTREHKIYTTYFGAYLPTDDPSFAEIQETDY